MISEQILKKVRKNQECITTNEDLNEFDYIKQGIQKNGKIQWRRREGKKNYMKSYYQKNTEEIGENSKEYYEEHKEEKKIYAEGYIKTPKGREVKRKASAKHYENHKKEKKEYNKIHTKTPEGIKVKKKADAKVHAKRKRGLGFEPLNEPFEGCEAHHIDTVYVVHIPKELHRSVPHNIFTDKGMEEINKKASVWLGENVERLKLKKRGKKHEWLG